MPAAATSHAVPPLVAPTQSPLRTWLPGPRPTFDRWHPPHRALARCRRTPSSRTPGRRFGARRVDARCVPWSVSHRTRLSHWNVRAQPCRRVPGAWSFQAPTIRHAVWPRCRSPFRRTVCWLSHFLKCRCPNVCRRHSERGWSAGRWLAWRGCHTHRCRPVARWLRRPAGWARTARGRWWCWRAASGTGSVAVRQTRADGAIALCATVGAATGCAMRRDGHLSLAARRCRPAAWWATGGWAGAGAPLVEPGAGTSGGGAGSCWSPSSRTDSPWSPHALCWRSPRSAYCCRSTATGSTVLRPGRRCIVDTHWRPPRPRTTICAPTALLPAISNFAGSARSPRHRRHFDGVAPHRPRR